MFLGNSLHTEVGLTLMAGAIAAAAIALGLLIPHSVAPIAIHVLFIWFWPGRFNPSVTQNETTT